MPVTLKQSDETLFKELLDRFFPKLKRFAVSFLGNDELAEEVVMDVFLKLWEKRKTIDSINNLNTYLFVAVRNTCQNYIRKENKIRFDSLNHVQVKLARYESTPEGDLISEEMLNQLNSVIELLPPKCKMIFKLLREEGLSRKDTAEVLGLSVKTIDNQVALAVKKIGESLGIDLTIKKNYTSLYTFLICL